jgi:CRISPR-associated protein Cas8c/Csd1 subtype I-C
MFLQNLYNDFDSIMSQIKGDDFEYLPSGYSNKKCHWKVKINPNTLSYVFLPLNLNVKKGSGIYQHLPDRKRSSDIFPFLIADNQKYVFGRSDKPEKPDYLESRHSKYVELLNKCYEETKVESIKYVIDFLSTEIQFPENLDITHTITFEVDGYDEILKDPKVIAFWGNYIDPVNPDEEPIIKQCCVTGLETKTIDVLKINIKCPSLTKDGLALITANDEVYCHYGAKQAQNSPISLEAAEKTHSVLNELILSPRHSKRVGKNIYVFWAKNDDSLLIFDDSDPEVIKDFFDSYKTGRIWSDYKLSENDKFKIYGLSYISSRLVIKYSNEMTMKQLYQNQYTWLRSIQLEVNGQDEFPKLWQLTKVLYKSQDTSQKAEFESIFMNSILSGKKLPKFILETVVRRAILDVIDKNSTGIQYQQIALIKACLYDNILLKGYDMITENTDCDDVAYNLGRLWAIIEKLQSEALGKVPNTSITDKNFKSVCSFPNKTMGKLRKMISYYLTLLRKNNYPRAIWLEKEITKITDQIPSFPDRISTAEQGMFLLGYWHKKSAIYTSKTVKENGEIENVVIN